MKLIIKIIIGSILSPLTLLFVLVANRLMDDSLNWTNAYVNFFKYVYPIGVLGVVVFGVPLFLLLRHFGYDNYVNLSGVGLVGGAVVGATATPILYSVLLYGGSGFLVASGFWLFVVFSFTKNKTGRINH